MPCYDEVCTVATQFAAITEGRPLIGTYKYTQYFERVRSLAIQQHQQDSCDDSKPKERMERSYDEDARPASELRVILASSLSAKVIDTTQE